jgi:hypothetical protein
MKFLYGIIFEIINRLFPLPPLEPDPKVLKQERELRRKKQKCFTQTRYIQKHELDELRNELSKHDF